MARTSGAAAHSEAMQCIGLSDVIMMDGESEISALTKAE
jgi:hypothetical protein